MPQVITSLEPEARSSGVRLQLDGEPFVTVAVDDVAELGLKLGAELPPQRVADLERRADIFAARAVATRMLAARPLPSGELVKRLVKKGHHRGAAEPAVAALVAAGLVNDNEFARHFARTRASRRRLGPGRLRLELQRMGIPGDEAESAVREALAADGVDVPQLLAEAAEKKLRSLEGKDPVKRRRSLRAYLLRRGFPSGDIAALLRSGIANRE